MKKNMYVVLFLAALLMTSCINTKRIVYLEDMKEDISYPMNQQPEMRIQRDDRISIVVNSRNPELTVPFNISTVGNFQVTSNGDVAVTGNNQKQEKGYTVDLNGYIEFPILGKLKVVDLTCKQVGTLICRKTILERCSRPLRQGKCGHPAYPGKHHLCRWQTDGQQPARI